jgi:hypothetical protein
VGVRRVSTALVVWVARVLAVMVGVRRVSTALVVPAARVSAVMVGTPPKRSH